MSSFLYIGLSSYDDFTIAGTATDGNGIAKVEIEYLDYDTDPTPTLTTTETVFSSSGPYSSSQTWSYAFDLLTTSPPANPIPNGIFSYKIHVTDEFGKVQTYDRYVNIDMTDPYLNGLSYSSNDPTAGEVNGSVLIQGSPADNETLVSTIYVLVTETDNTAITDPGADPTAEAEPWTLLPSTNSINHRINSVDDLTAGPTYYVYVIAEDQAGNRTAAADNYLTFDVDQTGNTPSITIDTSDGAVLTTGDLIRGSITDDDAIDTSSLKISFDGGVTSEAITTITSVGTTQVNFSHPLSGLSERLAGYDIEITGADTGEDFFDDTQDINPVSATPASITVYLDDSNPTASISNLNNGKEDSSILTGIYINDQFTITGSAVDQVQLAEVRAKLNGIDGSFSADLLDTPDVTNGTWTWSRSGLSLSGDSVTMALEVEDYHGNVTPYSYTLLVDTVDPTITVSTASGTYNGTIDITGTAGDKKKLSGVYLAKGTSIPVDAQADGNGLADPVADADYTLLGSSPSWSYSYDTTADNPGSGDQDYFFKVYSIDGAGNVSTPQSLQININQDSDKPVISLSQPTVGQELGINAKTIGTLTDDDGLSTLQIRYDEDSNGTLDADELYKDMLTPSGTFVSFDYSLASELGLSDGAHIIQLRSTDSVWTNDGDTPFNYVETAPTSFFIDTAAPEISLDLISVQDRYPSNGLTSDQTIDTNFNGTYINNDSTLTFTVNDANGIVAGGVQVSLDDGTSWDDATAASVDGDNNGTYTYQLTTAALSQGTLNIQYKAEDSRGKTTTGVLTVIIDTLEPSVVFTQPGTPIPAENDNTLSADINTDAPDVNGDVTIRGTVNDASSITDLRIVGGRNKNVNLTNTGNTINWLTTLTNSGVYANETDSYNAEDDGGTSGEAWNDTPDGDENDWENPAPPDNPYNVWRFPIKVTAKDYAGNLNINDITSDMLSGFGWIDIDPDGDKPELTVVAPSDGDSVSGTFLVNGTITDDDGTDYVEMQIDLNHDGDFGDIYDLNGDGDSTDEFEQESVPVQLPATTGSWSKSLIGSDFDFTNVITDGDNFLTFQVTPFDINSVSGISKTFTVYLDNTSPSIYGFDTDGTTETAEPTPASGSLQKEPLTLRVRFEDDKELLTQDMKISVDGGASFDPITTKFPAATIADQGNNKYYVTIPIDTTDTGGIVSGGNGLLNIQLSITDQTNKQNSKSLTYSVDNTLPSGTWNYNNALNIQDGISTFSGNDSSGGDYMVIGDATDAGTINGIAKVEVYFVAEDGYLINPSTGEDAIYLASDNTESVTNIDGITVNNSLPVPPTDVYNDYVISINTRSERGQYDADITDGDQDGFQESLLSKGTYDEWYAFFDTTIFDDGPKTVYYLIYDTAGNQVYGTESVQMSNFPPSIDSFDINNSNNDDALIQVKAGSSVNMTMNVSDNIAITPGAGTYEVTIAGEYLFNSGVENTIGTEQAFTPVAITKDSTNSYGNFISQDASSYAVTLITTDATTFTDNRWYEIQGKVTDDDGNVVTRSWWLLVNNNDTTDPEVTIDSFSQDNVGSSGHIEEATAAGNDGDADLSGEITITGTAFDNGDVDHVEVTIDGTAYDDTTTPAVTKTLSALDDGDPLNGVDYDWALTFDTATITGVAQADLVITADAVDTNGNSNGNDADAATIQTDPATLIVDVVPYITGITGAGFDSGLLTYVRRSAQGRYPIPIYDDADTTLTLSGYNLPGNATDAFYIGENFTAGTENVDFNLLDTSGDSETITVVTNNNSTVEADISGKIAVRTNNIFSSNNDNDNNKTQNKELSSYNDNLTDDRYGVFWDVSSLANTSSVSDPYMHPNFAGNGFEWMYVKSGQDLYFWDGAEKQLTGANGLRGGAFTYNENGSLIFLFNHNNQWSFYEDSFAFTGSVQYGQIADISTYSYDIPEEAAYNWNTNLSFGKLGLGNVHFGYTGSGGQDAGPNPIPYTDYSNLDLNRYENLQIETVGNNSLTKNYVAYFDTGADESRSIIFYAFQTSDNGSTSANLDVYSNMATGTSADAGGGITANIDKYSNGSSTDTVDLAGTQKSNNTGIATPRGRQEVTTVESGYDSEDFDLGVYDTEAVYSGLTAPLDVYNGSPIHYGYIAYFDEDNQALKITANEDIGYSDPTGVDLGTWTGPQTIDSNAGADVAMALDPDGGIHLAYQDVSSGYLKYAYLTYDDANDTFNVHEKVYVDALFGAGSNNSIVVRDFDNTAGTDYRPVILTYSSAFTGTRAPLRLSYPVNSQTANEFGAGASSATGEFLGNWETIALPAGSNPVNSKTFLYLDSSNNAYLGYEGSNIEEANYLGF